jgi:ferredoxin
MRFRVAVDENCCELAAYCSQIAPEVFDTTSGGTAHVRVKTVEEAHLADIVQEAAATCPTGAISVTEEAE